MAFRRSFASLVILLLAITYVSAAAEPVSIRSDALASGFPDNADLRSKLFSSLIGAPRAIALAYGEKVQQSSAGSVLVRAVQRTDDFLVEFRNGSDGLFAQTRRGTCVVQRSNAKGNYLIQAKIFLQDDPSCYLRLYAQGESTRADIVMYGALLKKGLPVGGMLYQVLVRPLSAIIESTQRSFDWGQVFASGEDSSTRFADELRDTTAASSRPASIARRLEAAASVEAFLAAHATAGEPGAVELGDPAVVPAGFSADRSESAARVAFAEFPRYVAGKGLSLASLPASLYLDAVSSPGSVYGLFGEGLRAIAVPGFDASGRFVLALFWGGREGTWDELFAGRKDSGIRVLRVPASPQ
jgi:hypothetical protein